MATRRRSSTNGTDEEIPALQSPSDSSESEDEPAQPPRPTTGQHPPLRPLAADVFDSDDSDITESDVRFARGLLRQFQQYTSQSQSRPNQRAGNGTGTEPSNLLEALFLPSSSEDEDDRDNRRSRSRDRRTNTMSPEQMRNQINDIIMQFASLSDRMLNHDVEREPDHLRAHVVIDGLEPVSKDLLSRYEAVKGEGYPKRRASCAVCYEPLDLDSNDVEGCNSSGPIQAENKKLSLALPYHAAFSEVVTFPCLHLFHSECLLPWLARKTTCPTCRFDVDPDSLTLKGGRIHRPWVPPADGVLEAWVQVEEMKKLSRVQDVLPTLEPEDHWSGPDLQPVGSGYETDESTSSVGSFRTCYDGDHRVL